MSAKVTLVIFTCEGKEHLLPQTYESFKKACSFTFSTIILAVDGKIDHKVIEYINPDILVQNYTRKGYIFSILNAISRVDTEYFFWLEDDFDFKQTVPFDRMLSVLQEQTKWSGIFLSRSAPLTPQEKEVHHFDEFYIPFFAYSVSPTLCRSVYIKDAFAAMLNHPKNENNKTYGFETFMDDYFKSNGLSYALVDPGEIPHVEHIGKLESTAREYHMINSLNAEVSSVNKEYISGFGYDRQITMGNKIGMLPKLFVAFVSLSVNLFGQRKAYDYAFRIYLAYKNKFNH